MNRDLFGFNSVFAPKARYRLYASNLVFAECGAGDSEVANERLAILQNLDLLEIDDETGVLASSLLANRAVPDTEPRDATHIAVAAINGIDFLLRGTSSI